MGLNNQFMIFFINPDFCKSLLSFTSAAQISKRDERLRRDSCVAKHTLTQRKWFVTRG